MTRPKFENWSFRKLKDYVLDKGIRMTSLEIDQRMTKPELVRAAEYYWRKNIQKVKKILK